jgi:hypothetical protein
MDRFAAAGPEDPLSSACRARAKPRLDQLSSLLDDGNDNIDGLGVESRADTSVEAWPR